MIVQSALLSLASARCGQAKLALLQQSLCTLLRPSVVLGGPRYAHVRPDLVGRNEFLVLVDDGSAEARLLDDDGRHDEPWSNLDQLNLGLLGPTCRLCDRFAIRLCPFQCRFGLGNLVASNPDAAVRDSEAHDVVDKGFGLARALGHGESVCEELFDHLQMRLRIESSVEREDGSRASEAVATEMKLLHCVYCDQSHHHVRHARRSWVPHDFASAS